jgi:hypothetical protein
MRPFMSQTEEEVNDLESFMNISTDNILLVFAL